MAEKLVVVSDMRGSENGLWITSYLGYLQQYFNIVFYDSRELARIDQRLSSSEDLYSAFINGGLDHAVAQLMVSESEASHYLTFCAGGNIAWHAALRGLPMKSIYAVSPMEIEKETEAPECPVTLLFGDTDKEIPSTQWAIETRSVVQTIPNFGHEMYTDEKIIQKVCLDLLELVLNKEFQY